MKSTNTSILLSTYNGERYLREQLDSIFAQTDQDWRLVVRDDGSTDATVSILQEYKERYPESLLLLPSDGNLGPIFSFELLMRSCDSDYVLFCDQDDVWLPNKVELTRAVMMEQEKDRKEVPMVVFTDLKVVDADLNIIADSFWKYSKIDTSISQDFDMLCVHGVATGCTMMVNRSAIEKALPFPKEVRMHDAWLVLCTSKAKGVIGHLSEPTILYRQHANNVVGAIDETSSYLSSKIKSLGMVFKNNMLQWKMIRKLGFRSPIKYLWLKLKYHFR